MLYRLTIFLLIFYTSYSISQVPEKITRVDESFSYRLPNDSRPLNYELYIETDIHSGSDKFRAIAKISIEIVEATDVITMHFNNASMTINYIDFYDFEGEIKVFCFCFKTKVSYINYVTLYRDFDKYII